MFVNPFRPTFACAVCDAPVLGPRPAEGAAAVCSAAPCRTVMARQPALAPATFQHQLRFHRDNLRAQRAAQAEKARLMTTQAAAEALEDAAHQQALAAVAAQAEPGAAQLPLVLPSGPRHDVPLTQRRRRAYRAHLYRMLRAAREEPGGGIRLLPPVGTPLPDDDPHGALRGQLCGVCAGGCCTLGGDVAYLTQDTMRRVMAAMPALGVRAIVDAYLSRLASHTEAGSCINHTRSGCSLPRALRSDTCNVFQCAAQKQLTGLAQAVVALVVVRRQNQWNKGQPGRPNQVIGSACVGPAGVTALLPLPATLPQDLR